MKYFILFTYIFLFSLISKAEKEKPEVYNGIEVEVIKDEFGSYTEYHPHFTFDFRSGKENYQKLLLLHSLCKEELNSFLPAEMSENLFTTIYLFQNYSSEFFRNFDPLKDSDLRKLDNVKPRNNMFNVSTRPNGDISLFNARLEKMPKVFRAQVKRLKELMKTASSVKKMFAYFMFEVLRTYVLHIASDGDSFPDIQMGLELLEAPEGVQNYSDLYKYIETMYDINELFFKLRTSSGKRAKAFGNVSMRVTYESTKKLYETNFIYACQVLEKGIFAPQEESEIDCSTDFKASDSPADIKAKEERRTSLKQIAEKLYDDILSKIK